MDPLFVDGLIYLAAAAVAAPLGRRLGLGAVLGYLVVGAAIGPAALDLLGDQSEAIHFAEFGVVLMLFLIGLEIDLRRLWRMRRSILGLGGLQVGLSGVVLAGAAAVLVDDWREALAVGLILALSSTAIVMQTLRERGLSDTSAGTQSFAVLLFQDIAVIPMIALLPLLGHLPAVDGHGSGHGGGAWIESLPDWSKGLVVAAAIALVVVIGRFLLTPWLRWVAKLKVTEALTATALALVVGVALLMVAVGLSPALGTFVAGVMLASSPFRHQLESEIEPFKALLLAVFFIAVGAGIDFGLVAERPLRMALMVVVLIALKALVLYLLAARFGLSFDQRLLFAAALAQGGEFAFVLGSFSVTQGVIGAALAGELVAAVALSMACAPLLLVLVQNVLLPRLGTRAQEPAGGGREPDVSNDHAKVILAGFGRFGHPLGRLLRSAGCMPTVLERDSDHVDLLRRIGLTCYYGDATRLRLLQAAGADEAEILIIAIDDEDGCMEIIETCAKHFPHLTILARACSRNHAYRLHEAGVRFFIEQLGSSLDCAIAALEGIGHESAHAKDAARRFKEVEMKSIAEIAPHREDESKWVGLAQQNLLDLDSLLLNAPLPVGDHQCRPSPESEERDGAGEGRRNGDGERDG